MLHARIARFNIMATVALFRNLVENSTRPMSPQPEKDARNFKAMDGGMESCSQIHARPQPSVFMYLDD